MNSLETLLQQCESKLLIGCVNENNFFETKQHKVGFQVDLLCEEAKVLYDLDIFVDDHYCGYDYDQNGEFLPQFYYLLENDEIEVKMIKMKQEFKNKIFLFYPRFHFIPLQAKWEKTIVIVAMFDQEAFYHYNLIPEVKMNNQDFEEALAMNRYIEMNYHHQVNESIEMLICGKYAYRMKNPYGIKSIFEVAENNPCAYRLKDCDQFVKIDLKQVDCQIKYKLQQQIYLNDEDYMHLMITNNYEALNLQSLKDEMLVQEQKNKEVNFIYGLQNLTSSKGLLYEFKDLVNFHTSIKTTPLTILAGMPGTGKTQLAYNYARMLSLSETSHTLLFVPISPSYSEPSDILGYINAMNHMYVPSETGLVKFLTHASKHEDQMHFIIFDEMNLSQVEHWFSSFISILEKDLGERVITIYDEDVECYNKDLYPSKINLKDNLIFVGTVNIDETTKEFSDRLLDRTSIIRLHKGKFSTFYRNYQTNLERQNDDFKQKHLQISANEFLSWKQNSNTHYMNAFLEHYDELTFLDDLDELIKKYIPNAGISYRVLKNIANYINNVAYDGNANAVMERKEVFDLVINQTIMSKIRGSESQISPLIGYVEEQGHKVIQSELLELLDNYIDTSMFLEVRKTIYRKAKDLMIHGYTN